MQKIKLTTANPLKLKGTSTNSGSSTGELILTLQGLYYLGTESCTLEVLLSTGTGITIYASSASPENPGNWASNILTQNNIIGGIQNVGDTFNAEPTLAASHLYVKSDGNSDSNYFATLKITH